MAYNPKNIKLEYGQIWESNYSGKMHWIVIGFGKKHVKTMTIDGKQETQEAIWHMAEHSHLIGSII